MNKKTKNIKIKINNVSVLDLAQMINGLIVAVKKEQSKSTNSMLHIAMKNAVSQAFQEDSKDDEE